MINESQEIIIKKSKTPAAVLAGPGTGKTYTIVKKVINLIRDEGYDANRILITSFTKKAAGELATRIISEFNKEGIKTELKDMMIGNFHSLAIDFLEKYPILEDGALDIKVIDENDEIYLIEKNINRYEKIKDFDKYIGYRKANEIKAIFEEVINYLYDIKKLEESEDPKENFAARVYTTHAEVLRENKLRNFQMILRDFYILLSDPIIGDEIRKSIDFVIVDEYQDINPIQEEIAFGLVRDKNIMVFGDDDQSLYSFRGADPKNLTDFSKRCLEKKGFRANVYRLAINYRSNQHIIDKSLNFLNEDFFERKNLMSVSDEDNPNTVVRARAYALNNLVMVIKYIKKYINLGQIAFLFPSLSHPYVEKLQKHFEENGIKVLNKKSSMFFFRKEIRAFVFILIKMAEIETNFEDSQYIYSYDEKRKVEFKNYLHKVNNDKDLVENKEIQDFLKVYTCDQPITDILYKALGLDYFRKLLIQDENDLVGGRVLTNISNFIKIAKKFDEIFSTTYDKDHYRDFVLGFLANLFINKAVEEYTNIETHKDAINFMTIHQAKGLEFDAVFVSGLYDKPRPNRANFITPSQDQVSVIKDFYRKYYTAFTRAKKLLVLLDNSEDYRLKDFAKALPPDSNLSTIDFKKSQEEKEKKTLSYTTDIEVYKSCPLKYRFIRKLGFESLTNKAAEFGTAVHKLVEYSFLRPEDSEKLKNFLIENQSYKYPVDNFIGRNFFIEGVETSYKLDRNFYILQGKVDISLSDGSILDIKTGSFRPEVLDKNQNQLMTYKHLIEGNGKKISNMYLYFIEEDKMIEVKSNDFDLNQIDKIAKLIDENLFYTRTKDISQCKYCQMKYFCKRD